MSSELSINSPKALRSLWGLFPKSFKKTSVWVAFLVLVGTLLEVFGLALVIPVASLLVNEQALRTLLSQFALFQPLQTWSFIQLATLGLGLLVAVFALKALFLVFMNWKQAKFTYDLQAYFSVRLYEKYIRESYATHLTRNSSQLIRNISTESAQLVQLVLNPAMTLATEAPVIFLVVVLLFVIEPAGAMSAGLLSVSAVWIFQRITKRRLTRWGELRQKFEGLRIQKAQEGLGGFKELKVLGVEQAFIADYEAAARATVFWERRRYALAQVPRLWLELIAVTGLSTMIGIQLAQGKTGSTIIPVLSVFAIAAFRLIPSATRTLTSIQAIRFGLPVISMVLRDLSPSKVTFDRQTEIVNRPQEFSFKEKLELSGVRFEYPNSTALALTAPKLVVRKGEKLGIRGKSGSGKSTLLDLILGLTQPSAGDITIDGEKLDKVKTAWLQNIGYVPQSIYLSDASITANVGFGISAEAIDLHRITKALRLAELDSFVQTLEQGAETQIGERGIRISGGQRQRLGLARALYREPDVLILDEATSALDGETEERVLQNILLEFPTVTLIMVTHRGSTLSHCDRVITVANGEIS